MIHVAGFVQGNIITPLELTTNYNRWRNEHVNSDFQSINGNPSKNKLTSRYKTTTQIAFTGVISKLQLPQKLRFVLQMILKRYKPFNLLQVLLGMALLTPSN